MAGVEQAAHGPVPLGGLPARANEDDPRRVLTPRDFTNPITGTTYRLRADGATEWRVTKVCEVEGAPRIRHLRGTVGTTIGPPADAIDRLVRGEHQAPGGPIVADPDLAMAEAVLLDADRISTLMTSLAAEARRRRQDGAPGFRPGCAPLRHQEREALLQATAACRIMADAWRESELGCTPGLLALPTWLQAALEDHTAAPSAAQTPSKKDS